MNYIDKTAIIGPNVKLGDNNYIGPYCIIGYPAEHKDFFPERCGCYQSGLDERNFGNVIIGDNNVFTGACTVDAGTEKDTIIGNDCFIMKRAHIGHDAHLHDKVTVSPNCIIGGHVIVMEGANLGQSVCTHQFVIIGAYSMLGMGSVVPKGKKVEPGQIYAGNPVRWLSENKRNIHLVNLKHAEQYNSLL